MIKELLTKFFKIKIIKYGIVGLLGTITNLAIFFIFVDILHFPKNGIAVISFLVAVTQNYILNHFYTFEEVSQEEKLSLTRYSKFVITSLLGLVINLIVLNIVMLVFKSLPFISIANAIAIFCAMIFNFIGAKFFVFKKAAAKGD